MSDETESKPARKAPVAALGGAGVAIGAALLAVFISTGNKDKTEQPAPADGGEIVSVQSADQGADTPPAPPATPSADGVTASADGALTYADAAITFSAALPPGSETDPVLKPLRQQALEMLAKYKADATADMVERKRIGAPALAWEVQLSWKELARAGGIASLEGTFYEFTGGAHGMGSSASHIARIGTGEELKFADMLQGARQPSPALIIAMCEALKTEKLKRIDSATIFDEPITCAGPNANVKADEATIVLAPSNEPDRFGGLYVFYDPYAVGSYAEGGYTLHIPQQVFKEDLKPEFKKLFSGTAPPHPDEQN